MAIERLIGRYTGQEKGPLLICIGGIHGNEPAGVIALETLFHLLALEPENNPDFTFCGRIIGLIGNVKAIEKKIRYFQKDLNRLWDKQQVEIIKSTPLSALNPEEEELKELVQYIEAEIASYNPERIVILDLHTTTAYGGIFSIATDNPESVRIAIELHAPVIKGMLDDITGTTLHYFTTENLGVETVGVVFESGQHDEHLSINRALAAIINCMRTIGCVKAEHVENRHDKLLIEYSKGLPKVLNLLHSHPIKESDRFMMMPNFKNFQYVQKGDLLAYDKNGPVHATISGRLLMPLYQKKGDDGFFLVQELDQGRF